MSEQLRDTVSDAELRRHQALTAQVREADAAYYGRQEPTLTDAAYDALVNELRDIESRHPSLAETSVLREVGSAANGNTFERVTHRAPMLSLGNAFAEEDLGAWGRRLGRDGAAHSLICELKIDGLSLSATYRGGRLVRAATRGDGRVGEDVTATARHVVGLRDTLTMPEHVLAALPEIEVRGEVYLPKDRMEGANEMRAARGETPYKTLRNAASGVLRQIDSEAARNVGLRFVGYAIAGVGAETLASVGIKTQQDLLHALASWGIAVNPRSQVVSGLDEADALAAQWWKDRDSLPCDIDGVVIKVNALHLQEELGQAGSREPRWAIARKWPTEGTWTTLVGVSFQIGRTGRVTPVGVLQPVEVGGVTVTNVTLHNADYMAAMDLHVGDRVLVHRSGEVIPQLLRVDRDSRAVGAVPLSMPTNCPACGSSLGREAGVADTYCSNMACSAQLSRAVAHAVRRNGLDVRGLGPEWIAALLSHGKIRTWVDLFRLSRQDLTGLPRMGEKKIDQLLSAISEARGRPLERFIASLGLPSLGATLAPALAQKIGVLANLRGVSRSSLLEVEGIAEVTADAVLDALRGPIGDVVDDLLSLGINPECESMKAPDLGGAFAGEVVVITGTFRESRDEIAAQVRAAGGQVAGSVSKKTTVLLVGEDAGGSKLTKARSLGVPEVRESEFWERIGAGIQQTSVKGRGI